MTDALRTSYDVDADVAAASPPPPAPGAQFRKRRRARCAHLRLYAAVLRNRPLLRLLLLAEFLSMAGDWFNQVALYSLIQDLTDSSAMHLAIFVAIRAVVPAFFFPLAGIIADRFDRRHILLYSNLIRAPLVLLYLTATTPSTVWVVFAVVIVQELAAALMEPARLALVPRVSGANALLIANALDGGNYSVTQFVGSALGGVTAAYAGRSVNFVADSISFVVTALLVGLLIRRSGGWSHCNLPYDADGNAVAPSSARASAAAQPPVAAAAGAGPTTLAHAGSFDDDDDARVFHVVQHGRRRGSSDSDDRHGTVLADLSAQPAATAAGAGADAVGDDDDDDDDDGDAHDQTPLRVRRDSFDSDDGEDLRAKSARQRRRRRQPGSSAAAARTPAPAAADLSDEELDAEPDDSAGTARGRYHRLDAAAVDQKMRETEARIKRTHPRCCGCWHMLLTGFAFLAINRDVLWVTMLKCSANVVLGGFDVTAVRLSKGEYNLGDPEGTLSLGLFFMIDGVGTIIGLFFAERISGQNPVRLRVVLFVAQAVFFIASVFQGWSPIAFFFFSSGLFWAAGSSVLYSFTNSLLQFEVPDSVRGRLLSFSLALRYLAHAVGTLGAGALIDDVGLSTHANGLLFSGICGLVTIATLVYVLRYVRAYERDEVRKVVAAYDEYDADDLRMLGREILVESRDFELPPAVDDAPTAPAEASSSASSSAPGVV